MAVLERVNRKDRKWWSETEVLFIEISEVDSYW